MEMAAELADEKASLSTFFDLIRRLYRDALIVRLGGQHGEVQLSLPELKDELTLELASRLGVEAILKRIELIDQTERGLNVRNLNLKLSLERLLIGLCSAAGREGLPHRSYPRDS